MDGLLQYHQQPYRCRLGNFWARTQASCWSARPSSVARTLSRGCAVSSRASGRRSTRRRPSPPPPAAARREVRRQPPHAPELEREREVQVARDGHQDLVDEPRRRRPAGLEGRVAGRVPQVAGRRGHEVLRAVAPRPRRQEEPRRAERRVEPARAERRGDRGPVAREERVDAQRGAEAAVGRRRVVVAGVPAPEEPRRRVHAAARVDEAARLARVEGHVRADDLRDAVVGPATRVARREFRAAHARSGRSPRGRRRRRGRRARAPRTRPAAARGRPRARRASRRRARRARPASAARRRAPRRRACAARRARPRRGPRAPRGAARRRPRGSGRRRP